MVEVGDEIGVVFESQLDAEVPPSDLPEHYATGDLDLYHYETEELAFASRD